MHQWPSLHPKPTRRQVIREEVLAYAKGFGPLVLAGMMLWWGGSALMGVARTPPVAPVLRTATVTADSASIPTSVPLSHPTRWSDPPTPHAPMAVVVMVTHTPTPEPLPVTLPTKAPEDLVPFCGMGSVSGEECKWPEPTPTPQPPTPDCATPEPGELCIWKGLVAPPIREGRGN